MLRPNRWRVPAGACVLASALALSVPAFTAPALAAGVAAQAGSAATGPVSTTPASGTPELALTKTQQTVRQLVKCGNTIFAVGRIWHVLQNGKSYTRSNVFSFSASAPYQMTGWDPNVDGEVNSIAFTNGHGCGTAYLGGDFRHVDGKAATNIAAVSTSSGAVNSTFERYANAPVETVAGYKDHLLVGGHFTRTNGFSRYYYESLSPSTGKVDGFINLHLTGTASSGGPRQIYNQQISHSGTEALVEGNFGAVSGQARQQIFMLNLSGSTAKVTGWRAPVFNTECTPQHPFYAFEAAWSPTDSEVYVATTGYHINNWNRTYPMPPPCDMALAFSASQSSQSPAWTNPTGCYSLFSVAADSGAVYFAGHQRYTQNPDGCKSKGSGAVNDSGLEGVNPSNGQAILNSKGSSLYSMSRANAGDMLITSAGLWIASSNRFNSNACDGVNGHSGICLLPYSG